jgi:hypothetical protein
LVTSNKRKENSKEVLNQRVSRKKSAVGKNSAILLAEQKLSGKQIEDFAGKSQVIAHNKWSWLTHRDPIVRINGWVASFTGLLLLVTAIQVYYFRASERAVILVDNMSVSPIGLSRISDFEISIANKGKSIAFIDEISVGATTQLQIGRDIDSGLLNVAPLFDRPIVVAGTGESVHLNWLGVDQEPPFSDEQFKLMELGNIPLYIFGAVNYKDQYSVIGTYSANFCFEYQRSGKFQRCPSWILQYLKL